MSDENYIGALMVMRKYDIGLIPVDAAITYIMSVLIPQVEDTYLNVEKCSSELDESIDSTAEESLQDTMNEACTNLNKYSDFLIHLVDKLMEYREGMAENFQVIDIQRKIYLDVLGIDEWFKQMKEIAEIDSEDLQKILRDSQKLQDWKMEVEFSMNQWVDWIDNSDGNTFFTDDEEEEKKYYRAKEKYEDIKLRMKRVLNFEEQLDAIWKNKENAKSVELIEKYFSVESLENMIKDAQSGDYSGIVKSKEVYEGIQFLERILKNELEVHEENGLMVNDELKSDGMYTPYAMYGDPDGVYTFPGGIAGGGAIGYEDGPEGAYHHLNDLLGENKYKVGDEVLGYDIMKAIKAYNLATINKLTKQAEAAGITLELSDSQWFAICDAAYVMGDNGLFVNYYIDEVEDSDVWSLFEQADIDGRGDVYFEEIVYTANELMKEGKTEDARTLMENGYKYMYQFCLNKEEGHGPRLESDVNIFVDGWNSVNNIKEINEN